MFDWSSKISETRQASCEAEQSKINTFWLILPIMLTRNILARWRQWKTFEPKRKALFIDNKTEGRKPYVCSPSSINHLCVNSILVSVFVVTEQSVSTRKYWQESLARSSQTGKQKLKFQRFTCPSSEPAPWCWWWDDVLFNIMDFFLSLQRLFWNQTRITRGLKPVISTSCSFIIASGRGFAA